MSSWMWALLAAGGLIVFTVVLLYMAIKFRLLDSMRNKVGVFALLCTFGLLIYCMLPTWAPPANTACECQCKNSVAEGQITSLESVVSGVSSASRVMASFFPSRGGYETTLSDDLKIGRKKCELVYYFFHWLVMMYVGLLLQSIFGRHLTDKFRRWTMRHLNRNKMCVFWGDPEQARILAENLRSEAGVKGLGFVPKILFLLPGWLKYEDSARASILRLSDKGYVLDFVDGLPSDDDKYNVAGKEFELEDADVAGRYHFLLSENSAYNIGLANAIIRKRSGAKGVYATEKLDLYIRVENSASSGVLKDWADAMMNSVAGEVNIHIFRETEVMAEGFIRRYPILKHRSPDGNESCGWLLERDGDQGAAKTRSGKEGLDVLIVGFGSRGQELLNIMLGNSQFLNAGNAVIPTHFTIVDKCMADGCCPAREIYEHRSPEIVEPPQGSRFTVEFKDRAGDVVKDGFEHFKVKVTDYDRIVVCTGNDELNVQIGEVVRREFIAQGVKLEKGRLLVQLQSEDIEDREKDKGLLLKDNVWPIEYFGMWKNIFTYEGIVDENKYYGARLLNWRYNYEEEIPPCKTTYKKDQNGEYVLKDGKKVVIETVEDKWRETKWFDKESSVASYRGMLNILTLMGYDLDPCDSPKEDVGGRFGEMLVDSKSKVWERLAMVEHLRWMAFMRTHGVRRWDLIEPSIEEVERIGKIAGKTGVKANVRELIGRHGALADYDELPSVNMRLAKYNGACDCCESDFTGEGTEGRKGHQNNLQWNDMKFVKWIPTLFSELWEERSNVGRMKIVKVRS